MQIIFKNEPIQYKENITIYSLLKQLKQIKSCVALAVNKQIPPHEQWKIQQIYDGDQILLFKIIAGD